MNIPPSQINETKNMIMDEQIKQIGQRLRGLREGATFRLKRWPNSAASRSTCCSSATKTISGKIRRLEIREKDKMK